MAADRSDLISWLNIDELKSIQISFYHIAGLPISIIRRDGVPLIPKVGGTTYCDILVQQSGEAFSMCTNCRLYGAKECLNLKRGVHYYCHMGLVEFTAPLVIDGQMVAYMSSGMVFDRPPVEREIREHARRFGIDPDFLWEAALKIPIKDQNVIERAAEGLYNYASIVSASADSRIRSHNAAAEIERAAQMKSDFLANMSHEIRTPMNAVIGMAELATQEEISPTAREYLENIQSSGKTLLHIINDILDYSKISSGKMSIFEDRYSLPMLIRDVTSIITNRLRDKSDVIFLYVDIDPSLPIGLFGDFARIQQVIINLANNAVKFTNSGFIKIKFEKTETSGNTIRLKVSVTDSGIGIKREDQDKLFNSFTQVDSRRNRNVEGTGLGLAIVKQLVSLMHGTVSLESTYGSGSTFSFEIPQDIADPTPVSMLDDPKKYTILMVVQESNVFKAFLSSADALGIHTQGMDLTEVSRSSIMSWLNEHKNIKQSVIIDIHALNGGFIEKSGISFKDNPDINLVLLLDVNVDEKSLSIPDYVQVLKPPITTISVSSLFAGNQDNTASANDKKKRTIIKFTAPTARVMVVDDIQMNLKLAERLLARMEIKADLALSGQEALDLLVKKQYDIIFMDHMMPGLDGIDTTRLIRRFHAKYTNTPIIALTANVMEDAKKMFLEEGMSDIIPKPIELKTLNEKLLQWLPPEKIIPTE